MEENGAFSTGLASLDAVLMGIRSGDNLVWQTDDINDYRKYARSFSDWAEANGRKLIYFRFAEHSPLIGDGGKAEWRNFDPREGFETFVNNILSVIEENDPGSCYVFDSLSCLAVDWNSDRMLGHFFLLVCPFLYRTKRVAYFSLLRNNHGPLAVGAIHKTAQIVLELYRSPKRDYILPIKVEGRYSKTLYMLHHREGDVFEPEKRSAVVSRVLSFVPQAWLDFNIDRPGIWTNMLIKAHRIREQIDLTGEIPPGAIDLKKRLITMMITRDRALSELCERYFTLKDLIGVAKRMICTGLVGGKAAGMLLARAILEKTDRKWAKLLETHDSFFIGSDVFYAYLIHNDCWWKWRQLKMAERVTPETLNTAREISDIILGGAFPTDIQDRFKDVLNYFGQAPVIARSSSLLEDSYGNAFSGKYESYFCVNQSDPEQRLRDFVMAVKKVYASTVSEDALSYRFHKDLFKTEEQMALLVQRVSGEFHDHYYFPQVAGVGYSFNPFVWNQNIDPSKGVLRLVFGLGTRAVDRHGNDYTRVIAINAPGLRPETTDDEVREHSQKIMDALDLDSNEHVTVKIRDLAAKTPDLKLDIFATEDRETLERAAKAGRKNVFAWAVTFEKLIANTHFIEEMGEMLSILQSAYNRPVDIEFTMNFIDENRYRIGLVQCRPFHFSGSLDPLADKPKTREEDVLLATNGPILGRSVFDPIERVIYIVPEKYGALPMSARYAIARLIGELTNAASTRQNTMLLGPGRWGSKMPALGIPVSFAEIRHVAALCEITAMHENLAPDISLGTHFFNDLVEMNILYLALDPNRKGDFVNREALLRAPNRLTELLPGTEQWADMVRVVDTETLSSGKTGFLYVDTLQQNGMVFLAKPESDALSGDKT